GRCSGEKTCPLSVLALTIASRVPPVSSEGFSDIGRRDLALTSPSAIEVNGPTWCHDILHFAFAEFEGWKPGARLEVCQGADCESLVLGGRAFEEDTFMLGEKRIAHVLTTRSACPSLPNHDHHHLAHRWRKLATCQPGQPASGWRPGRAPRPTRTWSNRSAPSLRDRCISADA